MHFLIKQTEVGNQNFGLTPQIASIPVKRAVAVDVFWQYHCNQDI
jgi:hypothetical protein